MGFASGLVAGSGTAKRWIDNYKKNKQEDIENKLFKARHELQQERVEVDSEGNEIAQAGMDLASMSGGDITNAMLERVASQGGTIDDQTYAVAWEMGQVFEGAKQKTSMWEERKALLDAKEANYENMIFNRDRANQTRVRKENVGTAKDTGWEKPKGKGPARGQVKGDKIYDGEKWIPYNKKK